MPGTVTSTILGDQGALKATNEAVPSMMEARLAREY